MSSFLITKRINGEYQFNFKADNGQVILSSEGYYSKAACENGIESVRKNSQERNQYESRISSNGKYYFNLKATNGQIIGTSELYESESDRDNGVASVKSNARNAIVEDKTI